MSQFLPQLFALMAEIEQINDQLNYIVDADNFLMNKNLFLAIIYAYKLSQLQREMDEIETQLDDNFFFIWDIFL